MNQDRAWWVVFQRVTPLRSLSCRGQHDLLGTGGRCAHQMQRLEADTHLEGGHLLLLLLSVAQSCPTLCNPMDCSMPGFPVHHHLTISWSLRTLMSIESVMPSNHLILCRPLLPLPSIRVFFRESALHISWPKYWSLTFLISPSSA